MTIEIRDLQKRIPIPPSLKATVRKVLTRLRVRENGLSLTFVTPRKIRDLNQRFLKRRYETDVLAFDLTDGEDSRRKKGRVKAVRGEIVISTGAVIRNAKLFGSDVRRELVLYVVHGILHLLGYDDHRPADVKRMRAKEGELMGAIFGPRSRGREGI